MDDCEGFCLDQRVMDLKTDPELLSALRKVHKMTPEEQRSQLASFVWGCLDIHNPMTLEDVKRILMEQL